MYKIVTMHTWNLKHVNTIRNQRSITITNKVFLICYNNIIAAMLNLVATINMDLYL